MGVNQLFGWIKNRFGERILKALVRIYRKRSKVVGEADTVTEKAVKANELYIDGNALLHQAAAYVYGYDVHKGKGDPSPSYEKVGHRFIEMLEEALAIIKPSSTFFLAMDGVAPVAKLQQQRARRFTSASGPTHDDAPEGADAGKVEDSEAGNVVTAFDRNQISPGTPFMDAVDKVVRKWLEKRAKPVEGKTPLPRNTIYSSHRVEGEGEHKLFEAMANPGKIKTGGLRSKGGRVVGGHGITRVIYANDNDLIPLSLVRSSGVFLMRERLDRQGMQYGAERFEYVDIDGLRDDLRRKHEIDARDFSILLLFVGNDFIPATPVGYNVYDTLDTAMKIYTILKREKPRRGQGTFALYDTDLRWDDIYLLINQLAMVEDRLLVERFKREVGNSWASTDLSSAISTRREQLFIDLELYRSSYYTRAFPGLADRGEAMVDLVFAYFEAWVWSTGYYIEGVKKVNPRWYYRGHYAPMLSEMRDVLKVYREWSADWSYAPRALGTFLNPLEQQIAILPIVSLNTVLYGHGEVRKELIHNIFWPLVDLFPETIVIDSSGRRLREKAIVMLPFVDPERVKTVAASINRPDIAQKSKKPFAPYEKKTVAGASIPPLGGGAEEKKSRKKEEADEEEEVGKGEESE